jgi:integrase
MATIRLRGDKWQVQVRRSGSSAVSKSFLRRKDAEAWARQTEIQADRAELPADTRSLKGISLGDLITRYRKEVTPRKRGAAVEDAVLAKMLLDPICRVPLSQLGTSDFARYRDKRLQTIGPTTFKRQLNPVRHMFEIAKRDWALPLKENPAKTLRFIAPNRQRSRRLQRGEYARLMKAAGDCRNTFIPLVIRFALATAMRRGEIAAMEWKHLDLKRRQLLIPSSKNGHARTIPLSSDALNALPKQTASCIHVFQMSGNAIHLAWDRLIHRAEISDLHFHDLRHEAISRFFELGLTVPEVAMISGHKDATTLFRYAHANAVTALAKLNKKPPASRAYRKESRKISSAASRMAQRELPGPGSAGTAGAAAAIGGRRLM